MDPSDIHCKQSVSHPLRGVASFSENGWQISQEYAAGIHSIALGCGYRQNIHM